MHDNDDHVRRGFSKLFSVATRAELPNPDKCPLALLDWATTSYQLHFVQRFAVALRIILCQYGHDDTNQMKASLFMIMDDIPSAVCHYLLVVESLI